MAFPMVWTAGDRARGQRAARWSFVREHAAEGAVVLCWLVGLVALAVGR
jgi:hypothetical protein